VILAYWGRRQRNTLGEAKEIAAVQGKTVGEVLSSLARQGLNPATPRRATRNRVPLLPLRKGNTRLTSDLVHRLRVVDGANALHLIR
jgi:hypothetical protein